MRTHRIYTDQVLKPETEIVLGGATAHYLLRVLRVSPGQSLVLFNGDGSDYVAEVVQKAKKELSVDVRSRLPALPESPLAITVVQAISRGERMDQTLQKCTELGATTFQPLTSERVEVRIRPEKRAAKMQHWQQVVISSCEQCNRAVIPTILPPRSLSEWLAAETTASRLVLVPKTPVPLVQAHIQSSVEIIIGPEGGFSDSEIALMMGHDVLPVSLGPRVLRTETAGPAAVALLQGLFGDLA